MKNKIFIYGALFSSLLLSSCAPVYKCGEDKPERGIQGSNRLLDVVKERDDLCEAMKIKDEENLYFAKNNQVLAIRNDSLVYSNSALEKKISSLQEENKDLEKKNGLLRDEKLEIVERYSAAVTTNLNQGHLYDERIKEKESRLAEKERDIAQREKEIQKLEKQLFQQDSVAERMEFLIRRALLGFDPDELTVEIKNNKVHILMADKLMFASGKAEIQTKGKRALQILSDVLKEHKTFDILVEGHTDNVPIKSDKYKDNWDLSVLRATSIVRILQEECKLDPLRLTAAGLGEYSPRASNATAEGRAKNRRTEIILSPSSKK